MRLSEYLEARDETPYAFALSMGIPRATVARIIRFGNPTLAIAEKIIEASRAKPAPGGGTVTYDDLRHGDAE